MRRTLLACLVLLPGLLALPSASAAGRTVSGDVVGTDFRAVDVLLGFEFKDSSGRALEADGSPSTGGYAVTQRINQDLGAEGDPDRASWNTSWKVTVPSNAATMYVEAYPKAAGQYGATDTRRYGRSLRRFTVPVSRSNVHIRMPRQCSAGGGTGFITGATTVGGARTQMNYVSAFSIGRDNNEMKPILGFGIGTTASNGTYRVAGLAPGSTYRIFLKRTASSKPVSKDVVVNNCAGSTANFAF